jgi:ferredoxin--NADP+ reductase
MSVCFAIVGSGPSGMYAADALLKKFPNCSIDVFDKIPMPFGLIRYGVAPDHFKTKNTSRQFLRTLELEQVRFIGNVEVGRDLSVEELKNNYDAVVYAIGAYNDRRLGIPGEDLPGVYGACAFVGWYNAHPDYRDINPKLDGANAAVIGIGNVALDVCRVLSKTRNEMHGSDISTPALDTIQKMPIKSVHMFGRRGPIDAGFTPKELGEMRNLERCAAIVSSEQIPTEIAGDFDRREKGIKEKNLNILRELAAQDKHEKPVKMYFQFYSSPVEIIGTNRVEGIRLERTEVIDGNATATGDTYDISCCSVITAIGYQATPPEGLSLDGAIVGNTDGWVRDNMYVVGWAKRGSMGTIPTNGPDSRRVIDLLVQNIEKRGKIRIKPNRHTIDLLLSNRGVRVVSLKDMKKITIAEINNAQEERPWEKFTSIKEMLDVLD